MPLQFPNAVLPRFGALARWFVRVIARLIALPIALLTALAVLPGGAVRASVAEQAPQTRGEFAAWTRQDPARAAHLAALERFLTAQGVAGVLPTWQLYIPDAEYISAECPVDRFVAVPRALWPNIVPTLRLVRDRITPVLGAVRVVSGFRPRAFNACIGSPPGSAHPMFRGFDLVAERPLAFPAQFRKLCAAWRAAPASAGFGLGAYWYDDQPEANPDGRFHVDSQGQRTWGFTKRRASSYCLVRSDAAERGQRGIGDSAASGTAGLLSLGVHRQAGYRLLA